MQNRTIMRAAQCTPGRRWSQVMPMNAKTTASSADEIAVFEAYVSLINSERETLWARHNALLLANSLIIGALDISPAALW